MAEYKTIVCPVCHGKEFSDVFICGRCHGKGEIELKIKSTTIERFLEKCDIGGCQDFFEAESAGKAMSFCLDCKHMKNYIEETKKASQEAKADAGKPRLSLVPTQIFHDIARVREYGDKKYGSTDNWKTVEAQRYVDAMFRHLLAFVADPDGRDEESGLPHLWHLECNAAFLSEMMKGRWQ